MHEGSIVSSVVDYYVRSTMLILVLSIFHVHIVALTMFNSNWGTVVGNMHIRHVKLCDSSLFRAYM